MLWIAVNQIVYFFRWLFVPPPARVVLRQVDVNGPCPCCGHTNGNIKASTANGGLLQVQHSCKVCFAIWFESPVVQPQHGIVLKVVDKEAAA